jgi:hypothetical protein
MQTCPKCDAQVAADTRFCPQCGNRLTPAEQLTPNATATGPREHQPTGPTPTQRLEPLPPPPTLPAGSLPPPPPTLPVNPVPGGTPMQLPPTTPGTNAAPAQGKRRIGLIVGIIAGFAVLLCLLLVGGLLLLGQLVGDSIPEPDAQPSVVADTFGPLVLSDNFDQPSVSAFGEGTTDEATYSFEEGGYAITITNEGFFSWSNAPGSYTDVAVEVDAVVEGPEDGAAAILFRYQDADNFYLYRVSADGTYSLVRYIDDEPADLVEWTPSAMINGIGEINRLRVEMSGSTIRLFVNDEALTEVTDDSFASGEVALAAAADTTGGVTVRFDNLEVREQK